MFNKKIKQVKNLKFNSIKILKIVLKKIILKIN